MTKILKRKNEQKWHWPNHKITIALTVRYCLGYCQRSNVGGVAWRKSTDATDHESGGSGTGHHESRAPAGGLLVRAVALVCGARRPSGRRDIARVRDRRRAQAPGWYAPGRRGQGPRGRPNPVLRGSHAGHHQLLFIRPLGRNRLGGQRSRYLGARGRSLCR